MREQIQVVKLSFGEPGPVFPEQFVKPVALLVLEDRLANAQRSVILAREHAASACRDHATDFLERLVSVELLELVPLAHTRKPARELTPARFAPRWHMDGFDEFAVR